MTSLVLPLVSMWISRNSSIGSCGVAVPIVDCVGDEQWLVQTCPDCVGDEQWLVQTCPVSSPKSDSVVSNFCSVRTCSSPDQKNLVCMRFLYLHEVVDPDSSGNPLLCGDSSASSEKQSSVQHIITRFSECAQM